jgi:Calcineurin-like phosphoesterase
MAVVYWFSDGAGVGVVNGNGIPMPTILTRWIRSQSPELVVYGGDVYRDGKPAEFEVFFNQVDRDVTRMCALPGNHDWRDAGELLPNVRIARGFEMFWRAHPESRQPIADSENGAARYDHFIDINGWRLIFVDTGEYSNKPWPGGDPRRPIWLQNALKPGRANMLFAHHSRISCGNHGHNSKLQALWEALFDATGPRVACTVGGHDHNLNFYTPRSKNDPEGTPVPFAQGIHIVVNGAGGDGHYLCGSGLLSFLPGKKGDICADADNFCITRINLIDSQSADIDAVSFGNDGKSAATPIPESMVRIRL